MSQLAGGRRYLQPAQELRAQEAQLEPPELPPEPAALESPAIAKVERTFRHSLEPQPGQLGRASSGPLTRTSKRLPQPQQSYS